MSHIFTDCQLSSGREVHMSSHETRCHRQIQACIHFFCRLMSYCVPELFDFITILSKTRHASHTHSDKLNNISLCNAMLPVECFNVVLDILYSFSKLCKASIQSLRRSSCRRLMQMLQCTMYKYKSVC